MMSKGEIIFPRKESTNWLSSTKWLALKTRIHVILFRLRILYLGIHMYIHMHVTAMNEKKRPWTWKRLERRTRTEEYNFLSISKIKGKWKEIKSGPIEKLNTLALGGFRGESVKEIVSKPLSYHWNSRRGITEWVNIGHC